MTSIRVTHASKKIRASVHLPSSKSISNRALILKALGRQNIELKNLSTADDTRIMQEALQQSSKIIHVKNAGTCMRFLTAYFACKEGEVELRGDERMNMRPLKILVDALKQFGAEISYTGEEGFPPLKIKGKPLAGGKITMDASVSSQFITALMLVAPTFRNGLTIELAGEISSLSYLEMTAELMTHFGYGVSFLNNMITISKQEQLNSLPGFTYEIEPDWSSASYWYEIAALSDEAEILLEGLNGKSLQGDAAIAGFMKLFGVETQYTEKGIVLKKNKLNSTGISPIHCNLLSTPDLAPAMAVTAVAKNMEITLSGLRNLRIKESDRLMALEQELKKAGFNIVAQKDTLTIHQEQLMNHQDETLSLETSNDHRLAMCFAPLALFFREVTIEDPGVVEKSYPHFWEDLKHAGFEVI